MKSRYLLLLFVLFNCFCHSQQKSESANSILNAAYEQAKKEGKNVFVIFHASWCGWCHKMDTAMNDPKVKEYFMANYVIKHLIVLESEKNKNLETPGAAALYDKYRGANESIPFWVILDSKGNLLADAQMRPEGTPLSTGGDNSGCPASEKEVAHLVKVLEKTSSLKEPQLAAIQKRFRLNDPEYK